MIKSLFLALFLLLSTSVFSQSEGLFPSKGYKHHLDGVDLLKANNWVRADQNFSKAHSNYIAWAQKNQVDLSQASWFAENLDYWVGIKMVINPAAAVLIFEELEVFGIEYSKDLLNYRIISSTDQNFENENLKKYENASEVIKKEVFSSRVLYALLNNKEDKKLHISMLKALEKFDDESSEFLNLVVSLVLADDQGDEDLRRALFDKTLKFLKDSFVSHQGKSLRRPVLQTLIYTRVFEVYGFPTFSQRLKKEISDVYINPVN